MSTMTYGTAIPAAGPPQPKAAAAKRPSLFARFMAARQKQAEAELVRHGLRLRASSRTPPPAVHPLSHAARLWLHANVRRGLIRQTAR